MNKPLASSLASASGLFLKQSQDSPASAPPQPGCRGGTIRVKAFSDSRRPHGDTHGRTLHREAERLWLDATGTIAIDPRLVTQLFVRALQRAGYQVSDVPGEVESGRTAVHQTVLEGRIWSFEFQTSAIPSLQVDLSLSLCDGQTTEILWQTELPAEDGLPIWIGVGCRPEEIFGAALTEVEEAALLLFSSETFSRAVGRHAVNVEPTPATPDSSHELVPGSSWTSTDGGEITATAKESDPSRREPAWRKVNGGTALHPASCRCDSCEKRPSPAVRPVS